MTRDEFIEEVARLVKKYAPKYGISVYSPIIGQACKESSFGTSNKVINNGIYMHNYFGLKFKGYDRVPIAIGAFNEATKEEYMKGVITTVPDASWYKFASLEDCVQGYFQFITNTNRYENLKGVTNPLVYCTLIKQDGYATGSTYDTSLYNDYVVKYNLTRFDEEEEKMGFTNSPLVNFTQISPNKTVGRNHAIDTISIHCVVGQVSVERLGQIFAPTSKQASSNYGIGVDGRIGMYVEEKDRSWCTSSASNDNRAITIECASDASAPYAVNDKVMASLIKLCADICKRNGIKQLLWKGDKSLIGQVDKQNMTVHRWFAAKSCPGDYLYNRHSYIADEVNKLLGAAPVTPDKPTTTTLYHTVASGESLSKIANAYGVTYQEIALWNNIPNPNKIYKGQVLKIYTDAKKIPKTYTVVKGDSLSKIGSNLGVAWKNIASANGISFPYIIRVGQVLTIP